MPLSCHDSAMYQAQQEACTALLHGDLMAQAAREQAQCRNMITLHLPMAYTTVPPYLPYTSHACAFSLCEPISRLHLPQQHHAAHPRGNKPRLHARPPLLHDSPKPPPQKGKIVHTEHLAKAMPSTPFVSPEVHAKQLQAHSRSIIDEARKTLFSARIHAKNKMLSEATEPRFTAQELVNNERMYLASVIEAARKKQYEQSVLDGTFAL